MHLTESHSISIYLSVCLSIYHLSIYLSFIYLSKYLSIFLYIYILLTSSCFFGNLVLALNISVGAYDDFAIDPESGEVRLNGDLNYDTRAQYVIEIVAFDGGQPSLSGMWTLPTYTKICEGGGRELCFLSIVI